MASIVFLDPAKRFIGSRKGLTFDRSQAGYLVKKKSSPINPQTNARMKLRTLLKQSNTYFWNLTPAQKTDWADWAFLMNIFGPYAASGLQAGCAAFFMLQLNARLAGDPFYIVPPGFLHIAGVTFTDLERIDKDTVRATFNPSPAGAANRIYLRQALPGPGVRQWTSADGYICPYSELNPNSPYDFTTYFQHLAGWNGRYWTGTQDTTGRRRATEDTWDLLHNNNGKGRLYIRPRYVPIPFCKR